MAKKKTPKKNFKVRSRNQIKRCLIGLPKAIHRLNVYEEIYGDYGTEADINKINDIKKNIAKVNDELLEMNDELERRWGLKPSVLMDPQDVVDFDKKTRNKVIASIEEPVIRCRQELMTTRGTLTNVVKESKREKKPVDAPRIYNELKRIQGIWKELGIKQEKIKDLKQNKRKP